MKMNKETENSDTAEAKSFLLTWYGLTDLRASLGFEKGKGPVLGALRSGNYTNVMILAYTNPAKGSMSAKGGKAKWEGWLSAAPGDRKVLSRTEEFDLVDWFANSPSAHQFFKNWLKREIKEVGLSTTVRICTKKLASLNDSKGIYDAAIEALEIVTEKPGDKEITFFVSPGTPVMAFTWSFVSLVNPELSIRIISSSEPQKPPVEVSLPYELLAPSSRQLKKMGQSNQPEFDIVFHLFGEQRIPSLFCILQFPARQHIFLTSREYSSDCMQQFLPEGGWKEIQVNPFDPMSAKIEALKEVSSLPDGTRVGFNLTGGTKLMFAGALAACKKIGAIPFYLETRKHNLVFLHDYRTMAIQGVDDLDLFFKANGFSVLQQGKWEDNPLREKRAKLSRYLWKERRAVAKLYNDLRQYNHRDGFRPFQVEASYHDRGNRKVIRASMNTSMRGYINIDGEEFECQDCPDFGQYLMGGWLEEYTYLLLAPLLRQGVVRDLRIGLTVGWQASEEEERDDPIQEFDIVLTDGRRLFILECKAGSVTSEYVYKLQQCVRNYGGIEARGIMVSAFRPHSAVTRKRLEKARRLSDFAGWDVTNELASYLRSLLS